MTRLSVFVSSPDSRVLVGLFGSGNRAHALIYLMEEAETFPDNTNIFEALDLFFRLEHQIQSSAIFLFKMC